MSGEQTFFSLTRLPWPVRRPAGWAALLWTLGTGMAYAQGSLPAESVNSDSTQESSRNNDAHSASSETRTAGTPGSAALPTLPTVEVQGQAAAQRRFDAAASFTSVAVDAFATPSPLVNLSELLAGQAGVVVLDRGNFAQDLQISVRGFGSRSTFGVRGVRLLVDGIQRLGQFRIA